MMFIMKNYMLDNELEETIKGDRKRRGLLPRQLPRTKRCRVKQNKEVGEGCFYYIHKIWLMNTASGVFEKSQVEMP